jgi:asparagine synthase (glutamine-hydrolysing)
MCGFLFFYFKNNSSLNNNNLIYRNFNKFKHRGPDNSNIEKITIDHNTLFIGHHRLSIIDLNQRSNQPMNSNDLRYKIIFNGEIYNHNDLRNELNRSYNIPWLGTSDTETLLYLLIHLPIEIALNKLIGMFSFVFLDLKEKKNNNS